MGTSLSILLVLPAVASSEVLTSEVAKLGASDPAADDRFGFSVSISGDVIVVGADQWDFFDSGSGSAYVFATTDGGATWSETAKLVASDAAASDKFGLSV